MKTIARPHRHNMIKSTIARTHRGCFAGTVPSKAIVASIMPVVYHFSLPESTKTGKIPPENRFSSYEASGKTHKTSYVN